MIRSFSELKEKMSPEQRERVEERAQVILLGMALQELRQTRHLAQQELANKAASDDRGWISNR